MNPEQWPQARSRGLVDAATEARIGELLAKMSLEQKVGQIIQTDISAVVPEDLTRYPLGSILAGGNGVRMAMIAPHSLLEWSCAAA